jgi:dynein heavy chain, axonemal
LLHCLPVMSRAYQIIPGTSEHQSNYTCSSRMCHAEPTKIAISMFSGEGENVEFADDCSCDGPVELWLQNVVDSMKGALIAEFRKAIPGYDEMPRTQWLYKHSAQNTIVVSRTFFTQEVNEAFEELEEGER